MLDIKDDIKHVKQIQTINVAGSERTLTDVGTEGRSFGL